MGNAFRVVALAAPALAMIAAVAGCEDPTVDERTTVGPTPSATTVPSTLAAPALRLPSGAPGDACPVSAPKPWSGPGEAVRVLGDGPVYPVADYFRAGTTLELRPDDKEPDGAYVKKVRWIGTGYSGPVLVRAARIDAPGEASAKFSYTGEARDGGYFAVLTRTDNDLPATTRVAGPGCYAYQVDGTSFSFTVVFRAVEVAA